MQSENINEIINLLTEISQLLKEQNGLIKGLSGASTPSGSNTKITIIGNKSKNAANSITNPTDDFTL